MSLTFQNNSQVRPTRMTHEFHPQNAPCSPRSLVHSVVGKPNQNNKLNMLNILQKKTKSKTRGCTGDILEFKESIHYVQKGHPTFVTQVDLILQN